MTHAVLIQVTLDPNADSEHRQAILHQFVVPEARSLAGFQRGTWMHDGEGTGTCMVLFDTEDNARAAVGALAPVGGPPVLHSSVCEVEIDV